MVGHKWVKAMATVVSVRGLPGEPPPQGPEPVFSITQALREYVVEVRDAKGQVLRAALSHNSRFVYPVGSALPVEVNFKSGEVKLDAHAIAQRARQKLIDRRSAAAGMTGGMVNVADQIQAQAADLAASGAMGGAAFAGGTGGAFAGGALAGSIADAVSQALGPAGFDAGVHV
jgi:hypothetical protein